MALTIHFGVVDIPYADATAEAKTTGDVAEILEDKYHIMETFAEVHAEFIEQEFEQSVRGALESLLQGAPPTISFSAEAESAIEERFKQFLSNQEMDQLGIPGVPTKAALDGMSHRFKRPYAKRDPRPSFIDTGLYQASMKVWVTE